MDVFDEITLLPTAGPHSRDQKQIHLSFLVKGQ